MLIKIMTNRSTTKIISNVTDIEIHDSYIQGNDWISLNQHAAAQSGNDIKNRGHTAPDTEIDSLYLYSDIELFDDIIYQSLIKCIPSTHAKVIDYEKNGKWHRLVILKMAYICNDDGKTISKVEVNRDYVYDVSTTS